MEFSGRGSVTNGATSSGIMNSDTNLWMQNIMHIYYDFEYSNTFEKLGQEYSWKFVWNWTGFSRGEVASGGFTLGKVDVLTLVSKPAHAIFTYHNICTACK